jgi:hypothetical protein
VTNRVLFAIGAGAIYLACALPAQAASATHVTSFTVSPTHVVGGSTQRAVASVSVFIDPNESTYFLPTYTSIVVQVRQTTSAPGFYYYQCADYVRIGSTSMTCLLPLPLPVTTSQTITLVAAAGNINYDNGNDPGMTATLTVDPAPAPTGTLKVATNLAAASFTITGPATYTGTGTSFTQLAAPTGTYTITCNPVPGYLTPSPQLRVLTVGGTATFARSYELDLRVRAGTGAGPWDPGTQTTKPGTTPVSATFPLGASFFIQLATSDLTGAVSRFTLSQPAISPPLTESALFGGTVAIEFDAAASADTKYFRAVHLGTELLTITPSDTSLPAVRVMLTVNRPPRLGGTSNEFDSLLIDLAHQRGIPPDLLKGQVAGESGFDPMSYRYEPLSVDLASMSRGVNLRTIVPFVDYRLATADGLPEGSSLVDGDIAPRSRYEIVVDGTRRFIAPDDAFVSALSIYQVNNGRANWSKFSRGRAARIENDPSVLNFTAQTPAASSYGLLQILYRTAVEEMGWPGIVGALNPSYLFDTPPNTAAGGGSLALGSGYLRRIFSKANPNVAVFDPAFRAPSDLTSAFTAAFNKYNSNRTTGTYGLRVVKNASAFTPAPGAPIFP